MKYISVMLIPVYAQKKTCKKVSSVIDDADTNKYIEAHNKNLYLFLMNNVLVLGAGMVSKPLINYLLKNNCKVKVACNTCDNALMIIQDNPNGEVVDWEADDREMLKSMVKESDIVVSLLPYRFHTGVASVCIEYRKHMVTTSYVSQEMKALDEKAREAGIIILNEIGLDPGIDHMSAMRIIDTVKDKGGKIEKFWSICGALPAPENADNPLGYKFTWSPEGVLLASLNGAKYLNNGEIIEVKHEDIFKNTFSYYINGIGNLVIYPNRDSISYIDIYGLDDIKTMFRGTFRFNGWCESIDVIKTLGLLSKEAEDLSGKTYEDLIRSRIKAGDKPVSILLADHLNLGDDSPVLKTFSWLGLFSDQQIPSSMTSPFAVINSLMMQKMMLGNDERDMVVLKHIFKVSYPDHSPEIISSQLIDYGSPLNDTSISRTVALPAAVAVRLILNGAIKMKGVYRPVEKDIYIPVLNRLEELGIRTGEKYDLPDSELIF